jgi:hypothetical protein
LPARIAGLPVRIAGLPARIAGLPVASAEAAFAQWPNKLGFAADF